MTYADLMTAYGEVHDLRMAGAVLEWDQQTQMPPNGASARGRQLATISGLAHEKFTSPAFRDLLAEVRGREDLSRDQRLAVGELDFHLQRAIKLPGSLVREMALTESRAFQAWMEARQAKDYSLFAPSLGRILELVRRKADCFGWEETPWNALVPDFERGMDAAAIRDLFEPMKKSTLSLLDRIRGAEQVGTGFLDRTWDPAIQGEFGRRVLRDLGYDFNAGRIDTAAHPFCTNFSIGDVRITTRYTMANPMESLMGLIHEAGHALYEQGFDPGDEGTPLAGAPSLGLHESQSRFWEVRIGRSLPFWEHYLPLMKQYFPGALTGVDPAMMYRALNKVEPGFIRVDADEVTYNLHIIIRFELELMLLDGRLSVADLPEAWNGMYRDLLGLDVPHDGVGCLQDIHWSGGAFGYFPSYTIGNIFNAMFIGRMEADMPSFWEDVRAGRFAPLLEWLRREIHRNGSRDLAAPLIERITGQPLSVEPLAAHLNEKYAEIYNL